MAFRRILASVTVILVLTLSAFAGSNQIVVQCAYGTDIKKVAAAYGGSILDYIPNTNTWLLSSSQSPGYLPQGVIYAEANLNVAASTGTGWILSTKSAPDWYRLQTSSNSYAPAPSVPFPPAAVWWLRISIRWSIIPILPWSAISRRDMTSF